MSCFEKIYDAIDFKAHKKNLKKDGWSVLPGRVNKVTVDKIKLSIDQLANKNDTEINYSGSEHRVWNAHNKCNIIQSFKYFSDNVVSNMVDKPCSAFDILAIRNSSLNSDNASLKLGRWHLDSFSKQLKLFLFLSDVSQQSGAFEMIPGTQRYSFKMKQLCLGNVITPKDLIKGTRTYSSFKEKLIENVVQRGFSSKIFAVKSGTMAIVDTSCIHRARPCNVGKRYALTSYYS